MWILVIIIIIAILAVVGYSKGREKSIEFVTNNGNIINSCRDFLDCIKQKFGTYQITKQLQTELEVSVDIDSDEKWTFNIRQFDGKSNYSLVTNRLELYNNPVQTLIHNREHQIIVFDTLIQKMNNQRK